MTPTILAISYAALAGRPTAMHIALAAGAPLRRFTIGERFPSRWPGPGPGPWRALALALVQASLLLAMACAMLDRGGVLRLGLSDVAFWTALTVLTTIANVATPSRPERLLWGPVTLAMTAAATFPMTTIFIAGATGYLGRFLCAEYGRRGWYVTALVRDRARAGELAADMLVEAEATRPETLAGVMDGADLVVSPLGITRQADGLGYRDVDYQTNLNLLRAADRAGVGRFAFVHVLNADAMRHVPLVAAKADFVDALRASDLSSTAIAPSGYFYDMAIFYRWPDPGGSGSSRPERTGSTRSTARIWPPRRQRRLRQEPTGWMSGGRRSITTGYLAQLAAEHHPAAGLAAQTGAGDPSAPDPSADPRPRIVLPERDVYGQARSR